MTQQLSSQTPLDDRDVAPWVEPDEDQIAYQEERNTAEFEAYQEAQANECY